MNKKFRLYYWLIVAFLEKYLLYISVSFFTTSLLIALYVLYSKDILRFFDTEKVTIGIVGKVTLNKLPPIILDDLTTRLFTKDPNTGEYSSEIVERWEKNPESTKFTLYLRRDLTYTDDTPFTSENINVAFQDVEIERPDKYTIVYLTSKPFPQFMTYLADYVYTTNPFRGIRGLYVISSVKYTRSKDSISMLILTPLVPDLPQKIYKVYPKENDLTSAYKLKEIDILHTTSKAAFTNFSEWPRTLSTKGADYSRLVTLFFNLNHPLLKEKDVRVAIFGSIPIKDLEEVGSLAVSPISPLSEMYDPTLIRIPENPELDRNILRRYFSEATESARFRLSTSFQFVNLAHKIQEIIQGSGGECTVDIDGLQPGEESDMILGLWDIPLEVNQYFIWHSTQKGKTNIANYDNKRVDKLLEDFRATDSATMQKKLMIDFQKRISEDLPAAFLYYPSLYTIERK